LLSFDFGRRLVRQAFKALPFCILDRFAVLCAALAMLAIPSLEAGACGVHNKKRAEMLALVGDGLVHFLYS
jgi:hypothetical protein